MIAPFDIHAVYAGMMVLGFVFAFGFRVTKPFADRNDRRRYYAMQIITLVSAVIGAKFAVLLGDALWPLKPFDDWYGLAGSGRSIVGALLFGFLAAEGAKPLMKYDIPPNDRFAVIVPFSIGIGRIGCLVAGCCRGIPWDGPLAITYADGIPRHPAPLYEMAFNIAFGFLLLTLYRRHILFGRLFALYLVGYGTFRFLIEFIRETAKPYYGLSAYQLLCVAMVIVGSIAIVLRTRHQPASWDRWKEGAAHA